MKKKKVLKKEKKYDILDETEQTIFSFYSLYFIVLCWADDHMFHSHGRESFKKMLKNGEDNEYTLFLVMSTSV